MADPQELLKHIYSSVLATHARVTGDVSLAALNVLKVIESEPNSFWVEELYVLCVCVHISVMRTSFEFQIVQCLGCIRL